MPNIGTLTVMFSASLKPMRNQLKGFEKLLNQFNAQTNKSFKNLSAQVTRTSTQMGTSMRTATQGMTKNINRSFKSAHQQARGLGEFFKDFGAKIQHYLTFSIGVQMVMQTVRTLKSLIDTTIEFERAAVNATTVSGHLGASFEKVRDHIMRVSIALGRTTVFTATDAANAFYNLASAGYDVAEISETQMVPILAYAAATQSELEEATYAVTTALKQFNMTLEETSRVADVMTSTITNTYATADRLRQGLKFAGAMAGTLGISFEETNAALGVLYNRGLEGGQAGQRLNMIFTKLLKPTDKGTRSLQRLGVSIDEINPGANSLVEILFTLKSAGFDAADAADLFRARTAASAVMLVRNAEEVATLATRLQYAGGIAEKVAEKQITTLWGSLKLMTSALTSAGLAAKDFLIPLMTAFADAIREYVVPVLETLAASLKKMGDMFSYVGVPGKQLIGILITLAGTTLILGGAFKALGFISADLSAKFAMAAFGGTALKTVLIGLLGVAGLMTAGLMLVNFYGDEMSETQKKLIIVLSVVVPLFYLLYKSQMLAIVATKLHTVATHAFVAIQSLKSAVLIKTRLLLLAQGKGLAMMTALEGKSTIAVTANLMALKAKIAWQAISAKWEALLIMLKIKGTGASFAAAAGNIAHAFAMGVLAASIGVVNVLLVVMKFLLGPIGLALLAIAAVAYLLWKNWDKVTGAFGAFMQWIKPVTDAWVFIGRVIAFLIIVPFTIWWNIMKAIGKIILSVLMPIWNALIAVFKVIWNVLSTLIQVVAKVGGSFGVLGGTVGWIKDMLQGLYDFLLSIIKGFTDFYMWLRDLPIIGDILKAIEQGVMDAAKAVGFFADEGKKMSDMSKDLSDEIVALGLTVNNLNHEYDLLGISSDRIMQAEKNLATVMNDSSSSTEEIEAAQEELTNARKDYLKITKEVGRTEKFLLGRTKDLLEAIANQSEEMSEAVDHIEDLAATQVDLDKVERDLIEATRQVATSQTEAAEAIAIYGENSENAVDAIERLDDAIRNQVELRVKSSELTSKMATLEADLAVATGNLTEEQALYIVFAAETVRLREELIKLSIEEVNLDAKRDAALLLLTKHTKYYLEKAKKLLDIQHAMYEAELKLYKLRKDEPDQLRDIWDKLVSEGIISDEIIEDRIEMEKAQGNLIKTQVQYSKMLDDLMTDDRKTVNAFVGAYIENIEDGMDSTDAWANAMAQFDITAIEGFGDTQIDMIQKYADAQYRAISSTDQLRDSLLPLVQELYDAGIISSDTADALFKYISNAYNAASATIKLEDSILSFKDNMDGVIEMVSRHARALQDEVGEIDNIKSVLPSLLSDLGLWSDLIRDGADGNKLFLDFLEKTPEQFAKMNEGEILAAVGLAKIQDMFGELTSETRMSELLDEFGYGSLNVLANVSKNTLDTTDTLYQLTDALGEVRQAIEDWPEAMEAAFKTLFDNLLFNFDDLMNLMLSDPKKLTDLFKKYEGYYDQLWQGFIDKGKDIGETIDIFFDITTADPDWDDRYKADLLSLIEYFNKTYPMFNIGEQIPADEFYERWEGTAKDLVEAFAGHVPGFKIEELISHQEFFNNWTDSLGSLVSWLFTNKDNFKIDMQALINNQDFLSGLATIKGSVSDTISDLQVYLDNHDLLIEAGIPESEISSIISTIQTMISNLQAYASAHPIIILQKVVKVGSAAAKLAGEAKIDTSTLTGAQKIALNKLAGDPSRYMQRGGIFNTPTPGVFGEAGAEALIPLEGANKRRGFELLQRIIPRYFGDFLNRIGGGFVGGMPGFGMEDTAQKYIKPPTMPRDIPVFIKPVTPPGRYKTDKLHDILMQLVIAINRLNSYLMRRFYRPFDMYKYHMIALAEQMKKMHAISKMTPEERRISGFQRGGLATRPTFGMFGESGAEALVPLEGTNKKYGRELLSNIIPSYYPDLMHQKGGLFTKTDSKSPIATEEKGTTIEEYRIMGPIYIEHVADVTDFTEQLKYKARMAAGR